MVHSDDEHQNAHSAAADEHPEVPEVITSPCLLLVYLFVNSRVAALDLGFASLRNFRYNLKYAKRQKTQK